MNLQPTSQTSHRESFLDFLPNFFLNDNDSHLWNLQKSQPSLFPAYLGSEKKEKRVLTMT